MHKPGTRLKHKIYGLGTLEPKPKALSNLTEDDCYFKPDVVPERYKHMTVFPIFLSDCEEA